MKKIVAIAILAILAMSAAAWAGEESWVFTVQQEEAIKNAIRSAVPGRPVQIVFAFNDFRGSYVDCHVGNPREYVRLDISKGGDVRVEAVGRGTRDEVAEAVRDRVAAVFNPSAGAELGRNLLERRGIK